MSDEIVTTLFTDRSNKSNRHRKEKKRKGQKQQLKGMGTIFEQTSPRLPSRANKIPERKFEEEQGSCSSSKDFLWLT